MNQYPSLETDRLLLGEIYAADIPNIIKYAGNKKVAETTLNMPHPYQEKDAIFWINMAQQGWRDKTKNIFAIRLKTNQELIGGIGLHIEASFNRAELGYWIAVPFWNQGYMTEAVEAVIKYGFNQLHLNKIFAVYEADNPASGKVMLKNGMLKEGELKQHVRKNGVYIDLVQYGVLNGELRIENSLDMN